MLNRIASFDFRDLISEVEYTLKLAKENVQVALVDELRVYTCIENFNFRIPSLSKRLSIFWDEIIKSDTIMAREFLLSLASPNWLVTLLGYFIILKHSYIFPFWVDFSTILISFVVFMIAFCASLLNTKLYSKEYLYLMLYPLHSIAHMVYNFPPIRGVRNLIKNTTRKHVIEKMTTNCFSSKKKSFF